MKTSTSQAGSHVLGFALLVVAVALIGFAGYRVWSMQQTSTTQQTASVPAKITNKATLDQAATVLDQSSAQLNSNLDDATLNTYLKALL